MKTDQVTIIKEGKLINIDEDEVRLGDVIAIQAGETVPADLRLIHARGLEVDEFEITGEILPVNKLVGSDDEILYMGSKVTRGAGQGVVIAIGEDTEYGLFIRQVQEPSLPFKNRILRKRYFAVVGLIVPGFIFHLQWHHSIYAVISVYFLWTVVLILLQNDPLIKTLLITKEKKALTNSGLQIKDSYVIDRLNDVDTVCFDKTGVLTTRHISVKQIIFPDKILDAGLPLPEDDTSNLVKIGCALCNDLIFVEKIQTANPRDKALLTFAARNGISLSEILNRYDRFFDQPFDSENRYMACGFKVDSQHEIVFAKGDPDVVLRMCRFYRTAAGEDLPVDFNFIKNINSHLSQMSQGGTTALALAYAKKFESERLSNLTFLCLLQLENPLQPGVQQVIRGIQELDRRCLLLTGDRPNTALRVSQECGISKNSKACLTGKMIDRMELPEIARQSAYCSVFARLTPSQKGMLIHLLQQRGS